MAPHVVIGRPRATTACAGRLATLIATSAREPRPWRTSTTARPRKYASEMTSSPGMKPTTVIAMSSLALIEEGAHQSPTAAATAPTAFATSAPHVRGFHLSSPVGSTYRRGLFTAYR